MTAGAWRTETAGSTFIRTAGHAGARVLWLVHAFGESSLSFVPLFSTSLPREFLLLAPDLPGAGVTPADERLDGLDTLAQSLAQTIGARSGSGPVGLVGHSLGAAVAVRAARALAPRVVGVFSIEGNLTEADAYFSGEAARFERPDAFRDHLLGRVRALAEGAGPERSRALWRYHASLLFAAPDALWRLGRSARAASAGDSLGEEYRAVGVPSLYYWSPDNTPVPTQEFIRRHAIHDRTFSGGHWPMIENPGRLADELRAFFGPLFAFEREESGAGSAPNSND